MLKVVPLTKQQADDFVEEHHSHLGKPRLYSWCVGVAEDARLCCVATAGQPLAYQLCDGLTVEINRVASDGTRHAASMAIGALARALLAIGYRRLLSYTILGEAGTSYKAAGWWVTARSSDKQGMRRPDFDHPLRGEKIRWEYGPGAEKKDPEAVAYLLAHIGKVELPRREAAPVFRPRSALGKRLAEKLKHG